MRTLIKKFFLQFDMFASYATFRTNGEPETRNLCGGILSFILAIYFTYVFIFQLVHASNWQRIQSIQTKSNNILQNKTNAIHNFVAAVGIDGINIEQLEPFLRFQFLDVIKNGSDIVSSRSLLIQKCKIAHWTQLGQEAQQNYINFDLKNKFCITPGQNFALQLAKTSTNSLYHTLIIKINACRRMFRNGTYMYSGCADQNITKQTNQLYISNHKYFVANVVYINTIFNPLAQKPTQKIMQQTRLTFTLNQGYQSYIWLTTYQITTDTSLWPIRTMVQQTGYFIDKNQAHTFQIVKYFEHASCTFILSTKHTLIQRNIGKIDDILSYVGGLFGIIIMILSFFMMSYNQYRYQILAAQSSFNFNKKGQKINVNNFTFCFYIKYQIFDWIKTLFGIQLNWQDCKQIDQTRQQSTQQLDISLMFKKIIYFQRFIQHIISRQKIGLFLTEPPSIQEVKKNRLIAGYYSRIMQGQPSFTLQDSKIINKMFNTFREEQPNPVLHQTQQDIQPYNIDINIQTQQQQSCHNPLTTQQQIQKYIQNYLTQNKIQLTQQQKQIEKQIANQYFKISQQVRYKIQMKIPLKILNRLYNIRNTQKYITYIVVKLNI